MSVFFRAVPLVMAAICLAFGSYIRSRAETADGEVAGHVVIALAAICFALFTTAATIIRQLIGQYGPNWRIGLPAAGYAVALATIVWGGVIAVRGDGPKDVVAGHVVIAVGLVAVCVSTVAAASTAFTLIPSNAAAGPEAGAPGGAYPPVAGAVLIILPAACAVAGFVMAIVLYIQGGNSHTVAAHVVFGLAVVCASLIALVASIVRQVRNEFGDLERFRWSGAVALLGAVNILLGVLVLVSSDSPARYAPGWVLIGLGLVCFSILSKVLLLALVWRRPFPLADRIPIIPVLTALACLFISAFLSEAATGDPGYVVAARVLAGLGAVCFTLFSIVSILEAGTSG